MRPSLRLLATALFANTTQAGTDSFGDLEAMTVIKGSYKLLGSNGEQCSRVGAGPFRGLSLEYVLSFVGRDLGVSSSADRSGSENAG